VGVKPQRVIYHADRLNLPNRKHGAPIEPAAQPHARIRFTA